MSIEYKLVEKGQPGIAGGGTKRWYAMAADNGEVTIDDLVKRIEKFSSLSEPDIRGVILALENVAQEALSEGKILRFDKLGSLYVTLSSDSSGTIESFDASLIKKVNVRYRPGSRIVNALKTGSFKRSKQ